MPCKSIIDCKPRSVIPRPSSKKITRMTLRRADPRMSSAQYDSKKVTGTRSHCYSKGRKYVPHECLRGNLLQEGHARSRRIPEYPSRSQESKQRVHCKSARRSVASACASLHERECFLKVSPRAPRAQTEKLTGIESSTRSQQLNRKSKPNLGSLKHPC